MKPAANGVGTNLSHPGQFGPDAQTIDQQWAAMDGRFNNTALIIKKEHATKDLQEFLEAANQHLKTKPSDATDVAHFLMGKNENLPQGLSEPGKKIPPETKKYLYDILRTNRYGAFGLKEPIAKTIAKLTQLQALVSREVGNKNPGHSDPTKPVTKTILIPDHSVCQKSAREPGPNARPVQNNAPVSTTSSKSLTDSVTSTAVNDKIKKLSRADQTKFNQRLQKVQTILSTAPVQFTSHTGWEKVKENLESYLVETIEIQGACFDRLLDTSGDQIFGLLATAKIMSRLSESKTVEMATQRDLYNISMIASSDQANNDSLGCTKSLARSGDDEVLQPGNQISMQIDTPIHCSNNSIKNITVLSCVAPALDSNRQPEFEKYIIKNQENGAIKLNQAAFQESLATIKNHIIQSSLDKPQCIRVVLCGIGTAAFLRALPGPEQEIARGMIVNMLAETALELNKSGIEVGFTDLGSDLCDKINQRIGPNQTTVKFLGKIPGDWVNDGDLLLNAWDPHSLLGNKLAVDNSIDGFIGRSTLIHFMHALICSMYNAGVIEKPPATSQGIAPVTENNNASGRIPPPTDPALNVNAV